MINTCAEGGNELEVISRLRQYLDFNTVGHGRYQHVRFSGRRHEFCLGHWRVFEIKASVEQFHQPCLVEIRKLAGDDDERFLNVHALVRLRQSTRNYTSGAFVIQCRGNRA